LTSLTILATVASIANVVRVRAPILPCLAVLAAGSACGPQVVEPPSSGSTGQDTSTEGPSPGSSPGASAAMTGSAATSGEPDGTSEDGATFGGPGDDGPNTEGPSADEGDMFISPPDVYCAPPLPPGSKASTASSCDLFAQDCPAGSKCSPAALCDASVWNSTACTPLDPNPAQVGEPCTVQDIITSGIDDCDIGLMCAFVDPDALEGTCVPLCTGSEGNPICESDTEVCTFAYDVMALCLDACNPLLDDCDVGTCVPAGDAFACFMDGGASMPGEPCQQLDDCAPQAVCGFPEMTGECGMPGSCCTSLCDLNAADPNAECLPGQACAPWYRPGTVMPPLDAVGVCTIEG
jgi:hypothetical protein